jgi:hypothetical protein
VTLCSSNSGQERRTVDTLSHPGLPSRATSNEGSSEYVGEAEMKINDATAASLEALPHDSNEKN